MEILLNPIEELKESVRSLLEADSEMVGTEQLGLSERLC